MNRMAISGALFLASAFVATPLQAQSSFAERLSLTGKVWGYFKYHHTGTCESEDGEPGNHWGFGSPAPPRLSAGLFWDNVLLENLRQQTAQDSDVNFNEKLATLIAAAGVNAPPEGLRPPVEDPIRIPSDKGWMDDPLLSDHNRQSILQVEEDFRPFLNCHVRPNFAGHLDFSQDRSNFHVADEAQLSGARLLGLFRFWNIINYFSPNKALIDDDWEAVLEQYVGRMLEVSDTTGYHLLMREFAAEVNDTHTYVDSSHINAILGPKFLPARLELVEGKIVVTRALDGVALQPGDEVISIEGESVEDLRAYLEPYSWGSNPVTRAEIMSILLMRTHGDTAELVVRRDGQIQTMTVAVPGPFPGSLYVLPGPAWQKHQLAECDIGYVNMQGLLPSQVAVMMDELGETDGIVFDIRGYPNGTLWTLIDYLYRGPIDIGLFHLPSSNHPGTMVAAVHTIGSGTADPYDGRLVLLFNKDTLSHAEFTVMGLEQHPGAVKIGSQTQGADGDVSPITLTDGARTAITGLGVYYPDGTPTQRVGIVPDVYVTPTIEGIRGGRDEVLEVALNCDHVLDPDWPPAIRPQSGPYYDPVRNGHGFDLSYVGDRLVLANYTFDEDGLPVWYLGTGSTDDGVFELDEGGYAAYSYDHTSRAVTEHPLESAQFKLDFKSGQQQIECAIENPASRQFPASLDWSQGDNTVRWCPELLSASDDAPLRPVVGMWYAGQGDSGWGITVRLWGQVVFIVVYYYDQAGQPTWAIASGTVSPDWPQDGPATFDLLEPSGFCTTCAPVPLATRPIGTIQISLINATRAFDEDNWVSMEALPGNDEVPWVRTHVPVVLLSDPEVDD